MPDSDDEYVQGASDDEAGAHTVGRGGSRSSRAARGGATNPRMRGSGDGDGDAAGGFELSRTWETVVEGEDGTIRGAIEGLLDAGKRRRVLKDTTPLQRGIIRHLVLIIDFSLAMADKDLRPTRHLLTLRYAQEFVTEYFEQNPISQLGIIGMRDGLAVRVSDMSGNPNDHIAALQAFRDQDPQGNPSLQNALEMARGALFHAPAHGTREILLIFGSLLSADPGDIHQTIGALVKSRITCTVIGLSAEVAVCKTLVTRTNPSLNPSTTYTVALNEQHYRELIMAATTPPPTAGGTSLEEAAAHNSLLMMGFPSRTVSNVASFCACHSKPTRSGYLCSQCRSKVCALPATCPACGLTLILSTHLARSYHHLFPLQNWVEVSWTQAAKRQANEGVGGPSSACFACLTPFPAIPGDAEHPPSPSTNRAKSANASTGIGSKAAAGRGSANAHENTREGGVSESQRYACGTCKRFFCIDCDVFAHEVVHNCPGCQSREGVLEAAAAAVRENGAVEKEIEVRAEGRANGEGREGEGGAKDVVMGEAGTVMNGR